VLSKIFGREAKRMRVTTKVRNRKTMGRYIEKHESVSRSLSIKTIGSEKKKKREE
jgi:hypothetical protein